MAFKKGQSGNPNGRKKGVGNKSTDRAREAIALFVEDNSEKLQGWLDQIATGQKDDEGKYTVYPDPHKAFNCVKDLMEYHLPKLQRTDVQNLNKDGEPADPSIEVKFT